MRIEKDCSMTTATQLLEKLNKIDVTLAAQIAIENTATEATKAQRMQLSQGLKSDGTSLPDYSIKSVTQYGKPAGPIKLYDTGDFYRGILIDVREDIFIIESADPKNMMLQNRYGKDILGLGLQARIEWIRALQPEFVKQIKNYLK